jgi:hypothetical protein
MRHTDFTGCDPVTTYTRSYVNMPAIRIHCTDTQVCEVLGSADALGPVESEF